MRYQRHKHFNQADQQPIQIVNTIPRIRTANIYEDEDEDEDDSWNCYSMIYKILYMYDGMY